MGSQLKQQLVLFFHILLILHMLLCVPFSRAKSCRCPDSDQDQWRRDNDTYSESFDEHERNDIITNLNQANRSVPRSKLVNMTQAHGLLYISHWVRLCGSSTTASFSVCFTMTVSWLTTDLTFIMSASFPVLASAGGGLHVISNTTQHSSPLTSSPLAYGGNVSVGVAIGDLESNSLLLVNLRIAQPSPAAEMPYTVWIDYDRLEYRLSVYIANEASYRPTDPIAVKQNVNFCTIRDKYDESYNPYIAFFGFSSLIGQLLRVRTFNSTVEGLPEPPDPFTKDIWRRWVIVCAVAGSVVATAIMAAGVACYYRSKQRRWRKEQEKLARCMQRLPGVPTQVAFADIRKATGNFQETMKLGRGGFGAVYRCTLPAAASRTGQAMEVAVKKFTQEVQELRTRTSSRRSASSTVCATRTSSHSSGWSYNKGVPLLIYDYMSNGSLDQHLFGRGKRRQQLLHEEDVSIGQWHTRYSITRDIATGLHYVHHEHEPTVLHRDIKASNIMLDSNFRARLGDFGIASTVAADRSSVTGIAGTWGYIAPDYAMSHRATRQTDIYAFGVLILEIVSGRKWNVRADDDHITDWVWRLHGEGKLLEAVDSVFAGGDQMVEVAGEAQRLLLLGLACTNPNPSHRPTMAEALQVITKLAPLPDVPPERPKFVWPPEEWRSPNSVYITAGSDWDRSSAAASTVELATSQAAARELGSSFISRSRGGTATGSRSEETKDRV
ncbi:hypothetical protein ACP70R_012132 [Stipagrostis hirtigluma subsp. patula]